MIEREASVGRAADAALAERVLRENVASVYAVHTTTVLAHLLFSVALAVFFGVHQNNEYALYWIAFLTVVDVYALSAARWTLQAPLSETPRWASKYARIVTLISVASAPAPFFGVSASDVVPTTVLTVVIMGSWTRAVQARWPLKPAMFGYGLPMMIGLIGALAWNGSTLNWFLAGFCTVNLILTLKAGVTQNRRLTESLMLRFENEELAARLKEQVAATERASEEKTRFLATASHDLRQPMHAIAMFGAAMESALRDHPEHGNAQRMMRAVHTLGASLDTMLDVSRLDAGVITAAPRALALDSLLLALQQSFLPRAEDKALQLRVRASGLWVCSDPHLLYRVLSNLVDNAIKYTVQGGVTVVARKRAAQVWLEVRDTGIGIAENQLERIFEEFYQVGNPGRDRARGLGIGLSIVQRLVRLLGHSVQVHSRLGRGTRLRLVLQAAEPGAQTGVDDLLFDGFDTPACDAHAAPKLDGRVLLIDDEAEIREAMVQLLGAYSIEVVAVADETQAQAVLAAADGVARPFALLMCDYRLASGADGLVVGQRLRERFGLRVPLMLITGETSPDRLRHVRASGVPTLFKPVSVVALLQALAELTSSECRE